VAAVVVGAIGSTGIALANFPHILMLSVTTVPPPSSPASSQSGQDPTKLPNLQFTWTEVGLGNTNVNYQLDTTVTATFGCVNTGSNHPKATNKTTFTEPVQATVVLTVDKNGNIDGNVVLDTSTVGPPAGFSCPSGQTEEALSATFAENTLKDLTNEVSATFADIVVTLVS
jgi:hypothetical protein